MPRNPEERLVICLPTYNEQENIVALVSAIHDVLPEARLLIVDDASPDGTGQTADRLASADGRVFVLHRKGKDGLGRAYGDGFRYALDRLQATVVVQMDADFSHPPAKVPELINLLDEFDLVIGSRYVPGGGTARWSVLRRLISRGGSLYARLLLGVAIHDLTSGFKAWRGELLSRVIAEPITASGYVFQVEASFKATRLGARIREVPFVFSDREQGESKMSPAIAFEASWRLAILALAARWQKQEKRRR